jgi:RNAse (barnase) inhibitor barstar
VASFFIIAFEGVLASEVEVIIFAAVKKYNLNTLFDILVAMATLPVRLCYFEFGRCNAGCASNSWIAAHVS